MGKALSMFFKKEPAVKGAVGWNGAVHNSFSQTWHQEHAPNLDIRLSFVNVKDSGIAFPDEGPQGRIPRTKTPGEDEPPAREAGEGKGKALYWDDETVRETVFLHLQCNNSLMEYIEEPTISEEFPTFDDFKKRLIEVALENGPVALRSVRHAMRQFLLEYPQLEEVTPPKADMFTAQIIKDVGFQIYRGALCKPEELDDIDVAIEQKGNKPSELIQNEREFDREWRELIAKGGLHSSKAAEADNAQQPEEEVGA
jgi:hypothetical protein